ncbi:MAG: hypothetical protein Q7O66_07180, partial [Dehalococcoidia bacterium]|nr:hypothetical protein [Dehalococcoidia bacterium]
IKQPRPRLRLPWFENAGTLPIVLVSAALLVAGLFFVIPLLFGSSLGAPSAPTTAATDTGSGNLDAPEAVWAKVDSLWKKGEAGDVSAWQEIVLSLERLQTRTPGDPQISGRLGSARTNLAYAQRMQEATTYWGAGDTRAPTTGNWAKVVSALEALLASPLSPPLSASQLGNAKKTLYSARVNYGKALEDAKNKDDAKIQYERARELDPARPEAIDALKRLAK